jgi:homoserine O-acetyltransferase
MLPASGAWKPGDPEAFRQFVTIAQDRPFVLEGGGSLRDITLAYETWGTLDASGSNAILVCHALTGDSHAAGPIAEGQATPGWWDELIGPGRALDTDKYFVVCANVLGGCQGTDDGARVGDHVSRTRAVGRSDRDVRRRECTTDRMVEHRTARVAARSEVPRR